MKTEDKIKNYKAFLTANKLVFRSKQGCDAVIGYVQSGSKRLYITFNFYDLRLKKERIKAFMGDKSKDGTVFIGDYTVHELSMLPPAYKNCKHRKDITCLATEDCSHCLHNLKRKTKG
jgi:hypothetical protein